MKSLPNKPGVYQFFNEKGKLIYVGKAKSLKKRVSSYFTKDRYDSGKTALLVRKIADIKYILVETELDALLLENSLIKKHQPRFNIQLRDDKTYPWICIKNERFPRIFGTRNVIEDGSEYFGPYASVKMMRGVLDIVTKIYKLRNCNYNLSEENIHAGKFRVCLEYQIGNCKGPCEGLQSEEEYNRNINEIREIIKGNVSGLIRELKKKMKKEAGELNFEEAQAAKSRIEILQNYQAKSTVVNPKIDNVDVFSIVSDEKYAYVNYMKVMNGAIVQGHTIEMKKKMEEPDESLLELAITELRQRFNSQSRLILVPLQLTVSLPEVRIHVPQRGDKKELLKLSERNARHYQHERSKQRQKTNPDKRKLRLLTQVKEDLRLKELPQHIECFDNSNLQGSNPVAACVVFKEGKPSKKDYRHFNIRTVQGPDDFASMQEVVFRRYNRLLKERESLPQLIVIDGGKGQLSAAVKALEQLQLRGKIAIIGIAKKLEEIYFPGDSIPLYIDKRSESLKLIQYLRNEAHRFGIEHHRKKRTKSSLQSELLKIEGIGDASMQKLLQNFKSVKKIKSLSLQELEAVLDKSKARKVYDFYH